MFQVKIYYHSKYTDTIVIKNKKYVSLWDLLNFILSDLDRLFTSAGRDDSITYKVYIYDFTSKKYRLVYDYKEFI